MLRCGIISQKSICEINVVNLTVLTVKKIAFGKAEAKLQCII